MNVLYFITPALFTSRLTSAHCAATSVTRCGVGDVEADRRHARLGHLGRIPRRPVHLGRARRTSPRAYTWPSPRLAPVTRATDPAICMGVLLAEAVRAMI